MPENQIPNENTEPRPLSPSPGGQPAADWNKPRVSAILRAAIRCFARSGFDTTTAEIAAEIGIPKSVIYHYFDDKMTLVREAQRYAYEEHMKRVREALSGVREKAGGSFVEILRQLWNVPATRDIAFQVGIWSELRNDPRVREQAIALRNEHHGMVAQGLAGALGIDDADPARTEPLSTLVLAALTGLSIQAYVDGEGTRVNDAHALFLSILDKGIARFAKQPDSELPPPPLESVLPPPYDAVLTPSQKVV